MKRHFRVSLCLLLAVLLAAGLAIVSNLTGITNATVKIQFKDLTIKEFEVNQIDVVNVPEGMD